MPKDKSFSIDVHIINSDILNAYAGLGGNIGVNSGLLRQAASAEELAGVLAHEIGHVANRDIIQGFVSHIITFVGIGSVFGGSSSGAELANYFLNMRFTRIQEGKADKEGLERLKTAHVGIIKKV